MINISSILNHLLETMTMEKLSKDTKLSPSQIQYIILGGKLDDITRKRLENFIQKKKEEKK